MQTANGIKAYWRETFKRWWNYRGLWRESLDDQPSAALVYRWLLISFVCLYVLYFYLNPYYSIEKWILITLEFMVPFIVYVILWYWGKIKNNRHVISVLMYLMLFFMELLASHIVGYFGSILELKELYYKGFEIWRDLYFYLIIIPMSLVLPILLMWIQGRRQVFIFSPILFIFLLYTTWVASGGPK